MLINKTWVVLEWSFSQKCFHIEKLVDSIKTNLSCFHRGGACDYVLLGLFSSDADASKAAAYLRTKRPDVFSIEKFSMEMEMRESERGE